MFASGVWSMWLSMQLCFSIRPAWWMAAIWWIFTFPILLVIGIVLSTRGSGSNATVKMTLLAPHLWLTLTTFGHLTLLRPMPIDVISCHNKNIWTSLTRIHSFIGLLIFLPFMVVRVTITYLRMLGMNWSPTLTCFTIRFHVLMFWHTPLMLIGMRTHRVIAPLRQLNCHCLQNVLIKPLVNAFTPDKKCLGYFSHPIFFVFFISSEKAPFGVWWAPIIARRQWSLVSFMSFQCNSVHHPWRIPCLADVLWWSHQVFLGHLRDWVPSR